MGRKKDSYKMPISKMTDLEKSHDYYLSANWFRKELNKC